MWSLCRLKLDVGGAQIGNVQEETTLLQGKFKGMKKSTILAKVYLQQQCGTFGKREMHEYSSSKNNIRSLCSEASMRTLEYCCGLAIGSHC